VLGGLGRGLDRRAGGRGVDWVVGGLGRRLGWGRADWVGRVLRNLGGRNRGRADRVRRVLRSLAGRGHSRVGWVSGSLLRSLGVVALGDGGNEASESSDGNGVTHFG
jgi:hypothetical protein